MTSRTVTSPTSQTDSDIRKITQSSLPAFALSALFIGSALRRPDLTRRTFTPPFVFRFGFGAIFAGGGYMLASGDIPNGSGVMTAWSMSYIVLEQFARGLEKKERLPRSGMSLVLCGASLASAALYGTEYFAFNDYDD